MMMGAQVSPSVRRALTVLILSVLSIWSVSAALVTGSPLNGADVQQAAAATGAAAATSATGATRAAATAAAAAAAAAAQCRLVIVGRKDGTLHQASMNCTGGTPPTVALDPTYVQGFDARFTGVKLTDGCPSRVTEDAPCLITICSGSLVLRNSRVSWVRNNTLATLLCVVHNSKLIVYNSRFTNNQVRPLMVGDQASTVLHASNVSNNVFHGDAAGGGLWVEGNANVTITSGSRVKGNLVGGDGGGLAIFGNAHVTITGGSMVDGNTGGIDGGGLTVGNNASVVVAGGSTVSNNRAVGGFGGGIDASGHASITLSDGCRVHSNIANRSGGGVWVGEGAQVAITDSSVHSNVARDGGGGGVYAQDASKVAITNSTLYSNTAFGVGGGICAIESAQVAITDSMVHDNVARDGDGGGVFAQEASKVVITNSSVGNNTSALGGGGLAAWGTASVTIIGDSSIHGNMALNGSGGGVAVGERAQVAITDSSVHDNVARDGGGGGGVHAQEASKVVITNSTLYSNTAFGVGGGICAIESAQVAITDSSVHDNVARDGGGGGVYAQEASKVVITNSSVGNNTSALGGGGLAAWGTASVTIIGDSSIHGNMALNGSGGGVAVGERAQVAITDSSVHDNVARDGGGGCGGGVQAQDASRVTINNSSVGNNTAAWSGGGLVARDTASVTILGGSRIHSNMALNGSGGGLDVSGGAVLTISGGCSIVNNTCIGGVGGGISAGLDAEGLRFVGLGRLDGDAASVGREDSNTRVTVSNSIIANNTSYRSAGGGLAVASRAAITLIQDTKVVGNKAINSSGGAVMVMGAASFEADITVVFANNSVPRGFVGSTIVAFDNSNLSLPSHGLLTKCSNSVYLGRTPCGEGEVLQHDVCICCPPHTFSFGNSSCTQCPPNAACPGASIVEPLPGFWTSAPTSIQMHRCPLFKTACDYVNRTHMCKPGYKGPLCGDCQLPEYGMLTPMRCGMCMPASTQLGLYLLFSFMTVMFVDLTVLFTWRDNLRGDRAVFVTDYIKLLVLFLQYMVIIGSVSVPWPLFDVQLWLQAIGIMVTMGSGQAMSLDCWLWSYNRKSKLPIALQRQLVYFLAPLCTLLAVLAVQSLVWVVQCWVVPLIWKPKEGAVVRKPFLLLRKLPVTVLVLMFYAFPTLVRASLSFFACLVIDKPLSSLSDVPVGATAPLSHRWGYWVSSIEQQCFAGYHLGWSMGLGLPSVLLWCLIVPIAMGVGLYLYRGRADTDSFREHFGFLYRTYKPECMWWEAVWAARTVVLTLISVFAFPMQRYFSVLSLLLIFLASAALQIMYQPYESPILHRMHLVSTSCLAATTLGALAMFAYDIQESTAYALRIAITMMVFVVNLAFVGWCCVKLVPALREGVVKHWPMVKAWLMGAVARVLGCMGLSPGRNGRRGRRGTSGGCWAV